MLSGRLDEVSGFALVGVTVDCHPRVRMAHRRNDEFGPDIPPAVRGVAVIDTGASVSLIRDDIAERLRLPSMGAMQITGVAPRHADGTGYMKRVDSRIALAGGTMYALRAIAGPLRIEEVDGAQIVALIGTDFLRERGYRFVLDGATSTWELHRGE